MPFRHNMNHRPYHNLKQMSHWMRQIFVTVIQLDIVVIKSREKSQISLNTLWNRIFYAAIRRPVRYMYHAPNSKNLSSSRANALATRTSWLVWVLACHSITGWTISTPHFTFGKSWLKKWFEFSSNPHDIGAAIAAWICLTVMQMSFSRILFTAKGNLRCFV